MDYFCQPQLDKHVEIVGFTEEERLKYITEVFKHEPEYQVNFLKYMFLLPHIQSMMYIPLNCAIVARVYYESQKSSLLAIPKTRTQLYKALTNCLLVRFTRTRENNYDFLSLLPEGLNDKDFESFKILAKFAFVCYHKCEPRMVTFFKEDIPDGFVHFGFMNECCEMYASKGVEQTWSFLHLSLQEYLAAWHLANSYSIDFQVAYFGLANGMKPTLVCKGYSELEDVQLKPLKESLVEPAIFVAGITGWKSCSEDGRNHWEEFLNLDQYVQDPSITLQCLYESQNTALLPHYFVGNRSKEVAIGQLAQLFFPGIHKFCTSYDCYALSYCLAHYSDEFNLYLGITIDEDIILVETFLRGLADHSKNTIPKVKQLRLMLLTEAMDDSNKCLFWITKTKLLKVELKNVSDPSPYDFLKLLVKLESLEINIDSLPSWNWLAALEYLNDLKVLHIISFCECTYPPTDAICSLITEHKLTEFVLSIKLPFSTIYDIRSPTDSFVDSIWKLLMFTNLSKVELPNVSRATMSGVRSLLLQCTSLSVLRLKRTNLGYDGILYLCSALRKNKSLKHFYIDDLQLPKHRLSFGNIKLFSFLSINEMSLPCKTTCTEFLMQMNKILKQNDTLKEIKIQSGCFLPLSAGDDGEYCQWTGLGPLQQFNLGAVGSGIGPMLKRSFSLSDLVTQPQTHIYWDRKLTEDDVGFSHFVGEKQEEINPNERFPHIGKHCGENKSICSFTSSGTSILKSFSGLDPRLKMCLGIHDFEPYLKRLKRTHSGLHFLKYMKECAIAEAAATHVEGSILALFFATWEI